MIGLLLITHETLGESLIQCVSHVLGKRPAQLLQLGVTAGDDPSDLLPLARQLLNLVDTGEGALILTDLYGATPSNLATKLLLAGRVEGLTGTNLPMLLRAISYRNKGMTVLLSHTLNSAQDSIINLPPPLKPET